MDMLKDVAMELVAASESKPNNREESIEVKGTPKRGEKKKVWHGAIPRGQ